MQVAEAHLPRPEDRPCLKDPPDYVELARGLWTRMSDPGTHKNGL